MNKRLYKLISLMIPVLILSACDGISIVPTYDGGVMIKAQKKTPPRIQSFDYSPKSTARKDDVITFTVNASNRTNDALQYNWKCSKGTLLSNSGNTVSWKPTRGDGSLETGVATITVTVSDDNMTVDASANVFINSNGGISDSSSGNSSYYEPMPYHTPRPTPYYSSRPYYDNDDQPEYQTDNSSYVGGRTIFEENFESGYLDDRWNISGSRNTNNYLTWKKANDDIRSNNHIAMFTGPTDIILADTCTSEIKLTSHGINLRGVKLPRLTFEARSNANPVSSVKIRVYWSPEAGKPRSLNVSFIPDKTWSNVDIDLQNILGEAGASAGLLSIGATVCSNQNQFKGLMIDNIKIYDASKSY